MGFVRVEKCVRMWCYSLVIFACCQDKLAMNITAEQGKTLKDAQGDVFRGLGWFELHMLSYVSEFSSIF